MTRDHHRCPQCGERRELDVPSTLAVGVLAFTPHDCRADDTTCQWTGCTSEVTHDPTGIHCDVHTEELALRKLGMD